MWKKLVFYNYIFVMMIGIVFIIAIENAQASGIVKDGNLLNVNTWQSKILNGEQIIFNEKEINDFNQQIIASSEYVYDLSLYPLKMSSKEIKKMMKNSEILNGNIYNSHGELWSLNQKNNLSNSLNLKNLKSENNLKLGIVVRRSNMRTLPTEEGVFEDTTDIALGFDYLQETAVDPGEPVVVLHSNSQDNYYFVQMYNYCGWIKANDVALVNDKNIWLSYVNPKLFLLVKSKEYILDNGNEKLLYQMGSRLLVETKSNDKYKIKVPLRDKNGCLIEETIELKLDSSLFEGYLPYNRNQIVNQAFKYLGEPYGWGGLKNSVDCSSLVNNVYRTFGICLPRNVDQQENTAGKHYLFKGLNEQQRIKLISESLQAGDILCMNGHVLIYLGENNGKPYCLHSLGSYTKHFKNGKKEKIRELRVVISDLSLQGWNGLTFLNRISTGVSFN